MSEVTSSFIAYFPLFCSEGGDTAIVGGQTRAGRRRQASSSHRQCRGRLERMVRAPDATTVGGPRRGTRPSSSYLGWRSNIFPFILYSNSLISVYSCPRFIVLRISFPTTSRCSWSSPRNLSWYHCRSWWARPSMVYHLLTIASLAAFMVTDLFMMADVEGHINQEMCVGSQISN